MSDEETARNVAATAAAEQVEAGMTIGLGSGRAVWRVIEKLAERFGDRPPVRAAFASNRTAELAQAAGIPAAILDGRVRLDLALDGADEIDPRLGLMKGGGGALLREKLVAAASGRMIVVADSTKLVHTLGKFPLPVEVVPFAWEVTARRVEALGCRPRLRRAGGEGAYVTDNGNYILDCHFPGGLPEPHGLDVRLRSRAGVVETGLFLGLATEVIVAGSGGVRVRRREESGKAPAKGPSAR